jgi:outer membrane immunogenic protein
MKRSLLASVSVLALTVSASATPPAPLWTGFYLGVNAGGVWSHASTNINDNAGNVSASTANASSATFGGQAGYNWQAQSWVYGLEVDWNWLNSSGTSPTAGFPGFNFSSKLSSLATGRGRVGYAMGMAGDWLPYVTAGVALGQVTNSVPDLFFGYQESKIKVGWTAGAGIEHMFAQHWTAKVEALYVDLGSSTVQGFGGAGYTGRFSNTAFIARAGVNYKW